MIAPLGMVHGRFQPFHNGHLAYVLAAAGRCERLLVGITNPDPARTIPEDADPKRHLPEANPFTYTERLLMVEESVAETRVDVPVHVIPFPVSSPELWSAYEDQTFPKRCGQTAGATIIETGEMQTKIYAAKEAQADDDFVLIVRTDARQCEGFEATIRRGKAYVEAGADAIFPEALRTPDEFRRYREELDVPLVIDGASTWASTRSPPSASRSAPSAASSPTSPPSGRRRAGSNG